jgi:hypothetical protein
MPAIHGLAPYDEDVALWCAAYARAQELLGGRQQTMLNQGDHEARLASLDEETTPTPALLGAWQLHQDQVVRS